MEYLGTFFEMGKTILAPLLSLKENEDILDKKIGELSCREIDVRADLEKANLQSGKRPKREVELWLKNVQNIKDEVLYIKQKLGELRWHHFRLQLNLAKLIKEKIEDVVQLKENGRFQEGLVVDLLPGSIQTFPTTKLVGETTALRSLKMIEECLMDDGVGKIGVYGIRGVGKTTIMTHIHNKSTMAATFNSVIWVTVSKDSCIEKLQDDVSKAMGVSLSYNKDALHRSAELIQAFIHRGRFLLILDDMWNVFPLTKVGIPEPNVENKCKIVWTTRSQTVCRGMDSQVTIKVDRLTNDESWTLFEEKLGGNLVLSTEIEQIAKAVVEECDGLPLGIITVGAAMRGVDDTRIWRNALEDLKNSRPELEGLEDDVFSCLRFSFDHLKTQRHRDCFLYCALYPEDHKIECDMVTENWIGDGFFDEIEDREKGFDKSYTIINDLKDACMLESANNIFFNKNMIKMHDLLRDLAIAITRKSPHFFIKAGFRMEQFPRDENSMEDVIRISLMSSNIEVLSCQSKWSNISTLLLRDCIKLNNIHYLFFERMHSLRVLDLSCTSIRCLPQSLSNLIELRVLLLRDCECLKDLPSLVKLRELRVLDLSHTAIRYLPEGMEGLINLRRLHLCGTTELEMFPFGIISSVTCLEELLMVGSKWKWSSNGNERRACVEEIARLTHLRKLLVNFMDLTALYSYVKFGNWRDLKCFLLVVGQKEEYMDDCVQDNFYSRVRKVEINSITECMNSLVLPESTLTLDISACDKIYIVTKGEKPFLPSLNELWIRELHNLRTICKEPTHGNLANLKRICIECCTSTELRYVFAVGWLQTLQNLEEIHVSFCDAMEEIVVEMEDTGESNNESNITITLPRLKVLSIKGLPKLKTIYKRILICNSLETIEVDSCPKLKMLPLSINNIPHSLKQIQGSRTWWGSLEWDNANTEKFLQSSFLSTPDRFLPRRAEEKDDDDGNDDVDAAKVMCGTKRKTDASFDPPLWNSQESPGTGDWKTHK
eukprot:TRINITY_DN5441_c0_g1_i10.p1 TRINITY_DN5441_c0_g1~~TRINITY_DN5441_c0_g1_i10.p1  ORF type:complete len:999 (+),score=154.40 TRINITY_DN5441_c0_g1_i10:662-3658(+)